MSTDTTPPADSAAGNQPQTPPSTPPTTFDQDAVNRIVQQRLAEDRTRRITELAPFGVTSWDDLKSRLATPAPTPTPPATTPPASQGEGDIPAWAKDLTQTVTSLKGQLEQERAEKLRLQINTQAEKAGVWEDFRELVKGTDEASIKASIEQILARQNQILTEHGTPKKPLPPTTNGGDSSDRSQTPPPQTDEEKQRLIKLYGIGRY